MREGRANGGWRLALGVLLLGLGVFGGNREPAALQPGTFFLDLVSRFGTLHLPVLAADTPSLVGVFGLAAMCSDFQLTQTIAGRCDG